MQATAIMPFCFSLLQPEEATAAATAAVAAAATAALFLAQNHSRLLTIVTLTLVASPAILNGARRKESRWTRNTPRMPLLTRFRLLTEAVYERREDMRPKKPGWRESLRNYRRRIPVEAYPFLLAVV